MEGESAGGTAKQGRDRRFQAILPLKGKILNVEKARYDKMLGHEEIRAMITALGCGIGKDDFDATKLRYGKIILMTDADVDGSHIRTLLLTFFFRHMTELIKRDNMYIAQPPLYKIKKGRFEQYIKDDREFVKVMVKRASDGMVVRHGENASKIEGAELTRFMGTLNEYLGFVEKVDKRIRNEKLTELVARARADPPRGLFVEGGSEVPEKIAALHAQADGDGGRVADQAARAGGGRGAPHLVGLLYRWAGRDAVHRLDAGIEPGVPADDGEVHPDQGISGAAVPDRVCRPRRRREEAGEEEEEPDAEGAPSPGSAETRARPRRRTGIAHAAGAGGEADGARACSPTSWSRARRTTRCSATRDWAR